jgi:ubiquinone/menaquinone biosynthesis C-methylase UbiE
MFLRENEVVRKLAPWLSPGETFLDLGSGTGLVARRLAGVTGARATGCDLHEFNNRIDLPYLRQDDPLHVPAQDHSFDTVVMCFVLHHIPKWEDQLVVAAEAMRVARKRVLVLEDTPFNKIDLILNKGWDWALNQRHGIPVPFTFRSREEWTGLFSENGFRVGHTESYRPKWPTLGMYHHTLFVLERRVEP